MEAIVQTQIQFERSLTTFFSENYATKFIILIFMKLTMNNENIAIFLIKKIGEMP